MRFISLALFAFLTARIFAATAVPVALTTVARTANVVTVTCAATCGIAANQGFVIAGVVDTSFNVAGTAVTAPTGTTFTFSQTAANASSTGGTVKPAKRVIVLSVASNAEVLVNYLLWLSTTSGVATTIPSAWSGISSAENAAILAGSIIEIQRQRSFPTGMTAATIQTVLQLEWSSRQTALATGVQPGQFFAGFYDGVGWSF